MSSAVTGCQNSMRKLTAGLFIALDGVVELRQTRALPVLQRRMGAAVDGHARRGGHHPARPQDHDALQARGTRGRRDDDAEFAKKLDDTARSWCSRQNLNHPAQRNRLKLFAEAVVRSKKGTAQSG
jgi:hypothetical protein